MKRHVYYLIVMLGLTVSCTNSGNTNSAEIAVNVLRQSTDVDFDSQIYCKLIDSWDGQSGGKWQKGILLVKSQSIVFSGIGGSLDETLAFVKKDMVKHGLDDSTIRNFKIDSELSQSVKESIKCDQNIVFVSIKDLETSFIKAGGWGEIREKYTDLRSIVGFSEISKNDKGDQALVYMSSQNGEKSGSGFYFLFIKDDSEWILADKVNVWVS